MRPNASASKTRSKDADLCYQAAEPETAEMVLEAEGEVGCLPERGAEPEDRTPLSGSSCKYLQMRLQSSKAPDRILGRLA